MDMSTRARELLSFSFPDAELGRVLVARAPGRVNIIGEHTDYNQGFVMPAATEQATWIAVAPRDDDVVRVCSASFEGVDSFSASTIKPGDGGLPWSGYLRGVVWSLREEGLPVGGVDAAVVGNVPLGAGVSSSASLEVAFAVALLGLAGQTLPRGQLARVCQRAENEYVGMRCGILDQYASVLGREGCAVLVDCRDLSFREIPLGGTGLRIAVCDTAKPRELVGSEYNTRREQCEEAARALGVESLRDADLEALEAARDRLDEVVYRRARHVVTENARCLAAAECLTSGDFAALGRLLVETHASLRDDYEVSCAELDTMVELALATPGCYGARLMGAGFGGSAIALVAAESADDFCTSVTERYMAETGREGSIFTTAPSAGAGLVE
jgi:galactokinase